MAGNIQVCFVGLGSIGRRHLKNIMHVADVRGLQIEVDALRHNHTVLPEEVASLIRKQIFDFRDVRGYDWVFVCNPSQSHYNTLCELKNAAKWFFVEKPVFVKPVDSESIALLGNVNRYYVACPLRYKRTYKKIKEYVMSHRILCARAICSSYLPDWRPGVDYRKLYSCQSESGGVKLDLIHEFDYLMDLFGFPQSASLFEAKISELEMDSCDIATFMARYKDKIVELHLDYFGRKAQRSIELMTPDETVVFDYLAENEDVNSSYVRELENFVDIALNGAKNINNLSHANEVLSFVVNRIGGKYA